MPDSQGDYNCATSFFRCSNTRMPIMVCQAENSCSDTSLDDIVCFPEEEEEENEYDTAAMLM
jgi:hypothetical protein